VQNSAGRRIPAWAAMATAAFMMSHQVGGKSIRDALFLQALGPEPRRLFLALFFDQRGARVRLRADQRGSQRERRQESDGKAAHQGFHVILPIPEPRPALLAPPQHGANEGLVLPGIRGVRVHAAGA